MDNEIGMTLFGVKEPRKTLYKNEWWFSVSDVIEALAGCTDPEKYIEEMRRRDRGLNAYWDTICTPLEIRAPDGKMKWTHCANIEGIFRIVQSIPSPKAEPFKRWLAKVGYERVQEIEEPALAGRRARAIYKAKGYSDAWIEKRIRAIAVQVRLTEEWNKRDVQGEVQHAKLTSEISKAAFGLTPEAYKKLKGLARENLRDHMTDLELIFSMLGEAATTEIARAHDAKGFAENEIAARKGGRISGEAREKLEAETGESVVTAENYLVEPESKKRLALPGP